jgi:hypothetical protein
MWPRLLNLDQSSRIGIRRYTAPRKRDEGQSSQKPHDPTSSGGEGEPLKRKDWQEPRADVKEPRPPGTAGTEEKLPRKGDA